MKQSPADASKCGTDPRGTHASDSSARSAVWTGPRDMGSGARREAGAPWNNGLRRRALLTVAAGWTVGLGPERAAGRVRPDAEGDHHQ